MTINQIDSKNLLQHLYSYLILEILCQECSTNEHPIYMDKIDNGLFFRCPLCKKSIMVLGEIKSNVVTHYGTRCEVCQELKKNHNIEFGRTNHSKQG